MPRRPFRGAALPAPLLLLSAAVSAAAPFGPGLSRAGEAFHWIRKLQTTGSVLQITAHPDDENGALLTLLSRGHGVRTALLSLTRGEAGANAIGPELFDALGWIRAAELEVAGGWYGLDRVYFTPLADYGYSKSLDEALRAWDEEAAAADVVEVVRRERPMVILARFAGEPRDGHGQHQFAGRMAQRAFEGAPDQFSFPQREARAFLPEALFRRAGAEEEAVEIGLSGSRPWLGHSFAGLAAIGLSLQRSQTRGVIRSTADPRPARLIRSDALPERQDGATDLLELLGPDRASLSARFGPVVPARLGAVLERLDGLFAATLAAFDWEAPEASLPFLGEALREVRNLLGERSPSGFFDVRHELERKERQLLAAARAAAGISFEALAHPPGAVAGPGPFSGGPTLGPLVPGAEFEVTARAGGLPPARFGEISLSLPGTVEPNDGTAGGTDPDGAVTLGGSFRAALAEDAPTLHPAIERTGLGENRYRTNGDWTRAAPPPPVTASLSAAIPAGGSGETEEVVVTVPVVRLEAKLPYGHERREVEILPPASVSFDPGFAAFSTDQAAGSLRARVVVRGHRAGEFRIRPEAPEGFRAEPGEASVRIGRAGEEVRLDFALIPGAAPAGRYLLRASVFDESGTALPAMEIQRIAHRDLPLRYLVRPAGLRIAVISLSVPEGIRVGYVRGAGDEVPAAIEALGAALVFLDEASLLRGDLSRFDAIVTGTRAYAIRPDLIRANRRLLDYAAAGGHLVVLYNTQELVPDEHAPFPGVLPRRAEEVSEEDSQVTILAPGHPLLNWPNRIGPADFEGWVEQRGSKFWSGWDPAYTPLFETADADQAPQRGGALTAEVGTGRYTYFAYALHRQLPEAVPGAFRLLANLIAASRRPR